MLRHSLPSAFGLFASFSISIVVLFNTIHAEEPDERRIAAEEEMAERIDLLLELEWSGSNIEPAEPASQRRRISSQSLARPNG